MALYSPDWRPARGARGVAGGLNPRSDAVLLLFRVTNGVSDGGRSFPVGVYPSRGSRGTVQQWDAFTSGCDARSLLVLALGGEPDSLGLSHKKLSTRTWQPPLDEPTPVASKPAQLELPFGVAA